METITTCPLATQDMDAMVRDAACGALVSIAEALAAQTGGRLPGTLATPVVKVIFDCLGEQKKEAQGAAGQALLQVWVVVRCVLACPDRHKPTELPQPGSSAAARTGPHMALMH
jgi:hypothetical protein